MTRCPLPQPRSENATMVTPCINVCVVHPVAGLCIGCGRTVDEIARWSSMSDNERDDVMALLPGRLASLGGRVSQKG